LTALAETTEAAPIAHQEGSTRTRGENQRKIKESDMHISSSRQGSTFYGTAEELIALSEAIKAHALLKQPDALLIWVDNSFVGVRREEEETKEKQ